MLITSSLRQSSNLAILKAGKIFLFASMSWLHGLHPHYLSLCFPLILCPISAYFLHNFSEWFQYLLPTTNTTGFKQGVQNCVYKSRGVYRAVQASWASQNLSVHL